MMLAAAELEADHAVRAKKLAFSGTRGFREGLRDARQPPGHCRTGAVRTAGTREVLRARRSARAALCWSGPGQPNGIRARTAVTRPGWRSVGRRWLSRRNSLASPCDLLRSNDPPDCCIECALRQHLTRIPAEPGHASHSRDRAGAAVATDLTGRPQRALHLRLYSAEREWQGPARSGLFAKPRHQP